MPRRPTFWEYLDDYPPAVVRLMARTTNFGAGVRALSSAEIALTCGMPISRVVEISYLMEWATVPIGEARAFCTGCNFDPTLRAVRKRQALYLSQCSNPLNPRPPPYLRSSPYWEKEFLPLLLHLKSQQHRHPSTMKSLADSDSSPSRAQTFAA